MRRIDEMRLPDTCLNKARDDERIFVLLERDEAAPYAIRAWAEKRIELGKNHPHDAQITAALEEADRMEESQRRQPG